MKKKRRIFGKTVMILSLIFFYLPIVCVVVFSFNSGKSLTVMKGFSLQWYERLFRDSQMMESVYTTVLVAVIAVLRLINSLRGYFSGFSIPAGGSARKISDAASSAGNAVISQYPSGLIIRICLIVIAAEAVILAVVIICGIAAGRKKDPPDTPQSSISSATGQ